MHTSECIPVRELSQSSAGGCGLQERNRLACIALQTLKREGQDTAGKVMIWLKNSCGIDFVEREEVVLTENLRTRFRSLREGSCKSLRATSRLDKREIAEKICALIGKDLSDVVIQERPSSLAFVGHQPQEHHQQAMAALLRLRVIDKTRVTPLKVICWLKEQGWVISTAQEKELQVRCAPNVGQGKRGE